MLGAISKLQPVEKMNPTNTLELAIGLPLRNPVELQAFLNAVANPKVAATYGHYLTPAQFEAKYSPTQKDYNAVIAFARSKGLTVRHTFSNRTVVSVSGSVDNIQKAFHVNLHNYKRPDGSLFHSLDREPSLDLTVPILHVSGLENYVRPRPAVHPGTPTNGGGARRPGAGAGSGPAGSLAGGDFRKAYSPGTSLNGAGQSVGLFELSSGFYAADIASYKKKFKLPNVPVQTVLLDGYSGSATDTTYANSNLEVPLDIDMAIAMAPGLAKVVVFEGVLGNSVLAAMASPPKGVPLCRQLSASWFWAVDKTSQELFDQMAAQGQTFFVCSGDSGYYKVDTGDDRDSQRITVVGGTALTLAGTGGSYGSETTWSSSGGGIESSISIPSYQSPVSMKTNGGSSKFRDLPDVSAVAQGIFIYYNNGSTSNTVNGTSVASPIWAGYMALVHEQQAQHGIATGFINPTLYALGESPTLYAQNFHDIKDKSSNGFYKAVAGYDLATGWGTPTAHLINAMVPPRHETVFIKITRIDFQIDTGDDDARGDSTVSASVRAPGSAHRTIEFFTLKAKDAGSWDNYTRHTVSCHLKKPISETDLGDLVITLSQGGSGFETDDNWNLQRILVKVVTSDETSKTVINLSGNPLSRLTGSQGQVVFNFHH
jgi:kumamolisin